MCSLYSFSRPVPCSPVMGLLMAILPGCTLSPARTRCNIGWATFWNAILFMMERLAEGNSRMVSNRKNLESFMFSS